MSERETEKTKEDKKRREELYDKFRDDLLKRQLSNSEHYDKAILSLSSSALALSLTAIKFVVPLDRANFLWVLKISWGLFLLTIILSLSAFLMSNHAISKKIISTLKSGEKQAIIYVVSHESRLDVAQARQAGNKSSDIASNVTLPPIQFIEILSSC